jgi:hypothetical protein
VRSATELTLALRKPEPEAPTGPELLPAPEAVPTLLTALASDDPKTRVLARRAADQLFKPNSRDRETFARIIAGIVDVLVQPNPSTRLVAVAMDRLADMGEDAKAIAINSALYQVAMGNMRARLLLESWNADRTRFAKAVIEQTADVPEYYRVRIGDLIQSLSVGPYEAAGVATRLLGDAHEPLSERIATLIDAAADPARIDRYAVLDATITSGTALSANVLKLLNLDATKACNHVAPLLRIQQPTVRLAAVAALKVTGLKGSLIRPALEPLLDDANDAVRLAAAEFLDRKEVIARIQVPSLLRELRSDNIERRMIAARQLDELGVEPKEITAALLRAVDRRDMPAREGLVAALEIAHAQRKTTLEMLAQAAGQEANSTSRVYARAALREVLAAR